MKTMTKEIVKLVNEEFQGFIKSEGLDVTDEDEFNQADESFFSETMDQFMAELEAESPDNELVWSPVYDEENQIVDISIFDAKELKEVIQVKDIDRTQFAA